MEKSDLDGDGKFTFEEFLEAMKENQEANKLIMQIADAQAGFFGCEVIYLVCDLPICDLPNM